MFSEGSNAEEFKRPTTNSAEKDADKNIESENSLTSNSSVNDSQSSVDDVIESSQDTIMSSKVTPSRRSLRKPKSVSRISATVGFGQETPDLKRNKWGESTLFSAVKKGDLERVKTLLSQGANPDVCNFSGTHPLHEAAMSSKDEAVNIINILLGAG